MFKNRIPYPKATFLAIYRKIAEKLETGDMPVSILNPNGIQNTTELGINWSPPKGGEPVEPNAASIIYHALLEGKHIKIGDNLNFGNLLYKKYLELQKNPDKKQVVVQGESYNNGLMQFLGFEKLEDFVKSLTPDARPNLPAPTHDIDFTYYIGLYYSFRSYRVNKFVLGIQYTNSPEKGMNCTAWGFHTKEAAPDPDKLPKTVHSVDFKGNAFVSGHHLYANLTAQASDKDNRPTMQLNLIGICDEQGGQHLNDQPAIPCSLQTVSLNGYVIALEAILVKCSKEEAHRIQTDPVAYYSHSLDFGVLKNNSDLEKTVQLYFMLQRRNFWVKKRETTFKLSDLDFRKILVSRYIKRLVGVYRIWNFGLERGAVLQSTLVVSDKEPFQARFYPYLEPRFKDDNPDLDKQLAVLVLSNEVRQDQLCFATFVPRSLTLVNYAIFDIKEMGSNEWVEGMFITTGYDAKGIVGGYAVMCKVDKSQEDDCVPMRFSHKEAEEYAKKYKLEDMLDGLRKLWKSKLWKQRSRLNGYAVVQNPTRPSHVLFVHRREGPLSERFDLPGGEFIDPEQSLEESIRQSVFEETGIEIGRVKLLSNESSTVEWTRSDSVTKKLHLIGAIYIADISEVSYPGGVMKPQARWIDIDQMDYEQDAFTQLAQYALNILRTGAHQ